MKRGDIYVVDLEPTTGREQAGRRHVLVVSADRFNAATGTPLVVPITRGGEYARYAGFTVSLMGLGLKTEGVIRFDQIRALDLEKRGARRIEAIPADMLGLVLANIAALFDE